MEEKCEDSTKLYKRLLYLIEIYADGNQTSFAKQISCAQTTFLGYLQQDADKKVKVSFLLNILETFPNVNRDWLFFGEGDIFSDCEASYDGDGLNYIKLGWPQQFEIIKEIVAKKFFGGIVSAVKPKATEKFLGLSRTKWQKWEAGQKASSNDMAILVKRLGISAHWLLLGEGEVLSSCEVAHGLS